MSDSPSKADHPLRGLPSVDAVLNSPELAEALASYRREIVVQLIRKKLELLRGARSAALERKPELQLKPHAPEQVARLVRMDLYQLEESQLKLVVNATGVLIHTNLGRGVLGARAREALLQAAGSYVDLEMHLLSGRRSQRDQSLVPLLQTLTGCESATVVNNCAAAVYLILWTLARRKEVITSRGELVEIGGNFRVPDVVRASGCKLVEVGATNRTRLSDYAEAVTPRTALLLKTHQSNYRIRGFTEEASLEQLAALAKERGIPLVFDAGSGLLSPVGPGRAPSAANGPGASSDSRGAPRRNSDEASSGLADGARPVPTTEDEPFISAAIAAGANLVCFSGDKLLGGPQVGIICGDEKLIALLRKSPLWRALRVDKLTVAALGATLAEQLRQPTRRSGGGMDLLVGQLGEQQARAQQLMRTLEAAVPDWKYEVIEIDGAFGGGTLPDQAVPGWAVAITPKHFTADTLHHLLRSGIKGAILGVLYRGRFCLHVAALLPGDAELIAAACRGWHEQDREETPEERERRLQVQEMARGLKLGRK